MAKLQITFLNQRVIHTRNLSMFFKIILLGFPTMILLLGCQEQGSVRQECENAFSDWQSTITGEIPNEQSANGMSEMKEGVVAACEDAGGWEAYEKKRSTDLKSSTLDGITAHPSVINNLKVGHKRTCVPNILRQQESVTGSFDRDAVELFCECVGNFYFNEISVSDVEQISKGTIPEKIAMQQTEVQTYCTDLHLGE